MSMSINTNIASLNAQRNTINNSQALNTTLQRLSSGLRVNSSKDDAAGMAIADRMNTQVRGMNVAIRNAGDGVSLAQVAEGGLAGINDMLQRMRELAVQGSNATNQSKDIAKIDEEYKQLSSEVNRMISATQFNNIKVLDNSTALKFQIGANSTSENQISVSAIKLSSSLNSVASTSGISLGSTNSAALATLTKLDAALDTINTKRAELGAVQSRFENTISFLRTAVENQSAARGRIMDADFAAETASLSRSQILQQAGTAMIAQANQLPQNVLSLLR